ncbi:MAG: DUF4390 domain-containing protein [Burkholderiaceae bacterium]
MIQRLFSIRHLLLAFIFAFLQAVVQPLAHADQVEVIQARVESSEEGYRLSAAFDLELNRELEDAIARGIPLYFTTEVQVIRPRRYWFDETTLTTSQTVRISYNVLTRQYRAAIDGGLYRNFTSLDEAMSVVRNPGRWVFAEKDVLKPGETYHAFVRMGLDVAQLPKPFQVNALNNSDWRLSSDWKQLTFKAEAP